MMITNYGDWRFFCYTGIELIITIRLIAASNAICVKFCEIQVKERSCMSEQQMPLMAPSESSHVGSTKTEGDEAMIEDQITQQPVEEAHHLHLGGNTRVVIHNDDVTPYDYVIGTLNDFFLLSDEIAEHVAWTAHTRGAAVVVMRPRHEAETLVKAAHAHARYSGFPLTFSVETDD
jgi:ATP-dependent Clp protease adaptor protein ClpS